MREIVFDTESTGLDPRGGDRLVEIGCVELVNHIPTGRVFHTYVNPQRQVSSGAYEVHGLSTTFLADKPTFAQIADGFIDFVEEDILIAHNAPFDTGFLNMELGRLDRPPIAEARVIDTLALARRKHPAGPNSLDALCGRYGIDKSRRVKHGALLDAELLAEVYIELIGGKQAHMSFDQAAGRSGLAGAGPAAARPEPLPPRLTAEEAAAHEAFIETLGSDALWKRFL